MSDPSNLGIHGTVFDVELSTGPGTGGNSSAVFRGTCLGFVRELSAKLVDAAGRGDGDFPEQWFSTGSGSLVLSGLESNANFPIPDNFNGTTGTVTRWLEVLPDGSKKTETLKVQVIGHTVEKNQKSDDARARLKSLELRITDPPAMSGWPSGVTQGTSPDPSHATKELWRGIRKVADQRALLDNAGQLFIVWKPGDNDAAEKTILDTVKASAAAPFAGMKQRECTFSRASAKIGYIAIEWGLLDSKDDVEFPRRKVETDPNRLGDSNSTATLYANGSESNAASTLSGLKLRTQLRTPITPTQSVQEALYARRDTKDDQELPRTFTDKAADGSNLGNTFGAAALNGTATFTAAQTSLGAVPRTRRTEHPTDQTTLEVLEGGMRSVTQDYTQPSSFEKSDPNSIESQEAIAQVYLTASPPATPDANLGDVKLVSQHAQEVDAYQSRRITEFGVRDSKDNTLFPRIKVTNDPNNLNSSNSTATLYANGSAPNTPATLSGLKLREQSDVPITPTQSVREALYAERDSKDDHELPHIFTQRDGFNLTDEFGGAALNATATFTAAQLAAGAVLRSTRVEQVTTGQNLNVIFGGLRSAKDDAEMPESFVNRDTNGIETTGANANVYFTASGPPAASTPPSGTKLAGNHTQVLNGRTSRRVERFAARDSKDNQELPHVFTQQDAGGSNLNNTFGAASLNGTATFTAAQTALGAVARNRRTEHPTDQITLQILEGGMRSISQDFTQPESMIKSDPNLLDSEQLIAEVYLSGSEPILPTQDLTEVKYVSKHIQEVNAYQSRRITSFGTRNSNDNINFPGTIARLESAEAESGQVTSLISVNSAADLHTVLAAQYNASNTATGFAGVAVNRITDTLARLVVTKRFDAVETIQELDCDEDAVRSVSGQVFVRDIYQVSANRWFAEVSWCPGFFGKGVFIAKRRLTSNVAVDADDASITHRTLLGTSGKSGNFIARAPAEWFIYSGWKIQDVFSRAGTRYIDVDYKFKIKTNGWYRDMMVTPNWYMINVSLTPGFVSPTWFAFNVANPTADTGTQLRDAFLV